MDSDLIEALMAVVLVGGATVTTGVAVTVGGIWYGAKRLRRSTGVRRSLERGTTGLRALSRDASLRDLAQLHLKVDNAMRANERALEAATLAGRPVGQLPLLAEELRNSGEDLSRQLRVAQDEPDASIRTRLAREFEESVGRFVRLSGDLRAASISGGRSSGRDLQGVAERLTLEISALSAWDEAYAPHRHGLEQVRPAAEHTQETRW